MNVTSLLERAFALGVFAAVASASMAQIGPGDMFPSFVPNRLKGDSLPETAGHVILVDFWASWCAPCKASFPIYSQLQAEYSHRGLIVVGIGVDDSLSTYASFVARLKPAFATYNDANHVFVREVEVPTMPTSYLVDRCGKVRFVHSGFGGQRTERELRREIETLVAEPAPKS